MDDGAITIQQKTTPIINQQDKRNFQFSINNIAKDIAYYQQFAQNSLTLSSLSPNILASLQKAQKKTEQKKHQHLAFNHFTNKIYQQIFINKISLITLPPCHF